MEGSGQIAVVPWIPWCGETGRIPSSVSALYSIVLPAAVAAGNS